MEITVIESLTNLKGTLSLFRLLFLLLIFCARRLIKAQVESTFTGVKEGIEGNRTAVCSVGLSGTKSLV